MTIPLLKLMIGSAPTRVIAVVTLGIRGTCVIDRVAVGKSGSMVINQVFKCR